MKILIQIIDFLFLVKEIRSKSGELHFKRWSLTTRFLHSFFDKYLFNIYIHFINRADEDKDMHDHPWNFISIILSGGYKELTNKGISFRMPFSFSYKKSTEFHRVIRLIDPTYTLVLTSKRKREWGFITNDGWFNNIQYRKRKRDLETKI